MTTDEALASLIAHDPSRTWAIIEDTWYWHEFAEGQRLGKSYRISLFSDSIAHPVDQITDSDLVTAVVLAKELHHRLTLTKPPLAIH